VSTDVKKAVAGPFSPASALYHISRQFHCAYTQITKSAKNAVPPEIQLRRTRGPADLAYFLSQKQIPEQVTHLTLQAVSTVRISHKSIWLVVPLSHPLVVP